MAPTEIRLTWIAVAPAGIDLHALAAPTAETVIVSEAPSGELPRADIRRDPGVDESTGDDRGDGGRGAGAGRLDEADTTGPCGHRHGRTDGGPTRTNRTHDKLSPLHQSEERDARLGNVFASPVGPVRYRLEPSLRMPAAHTCVIPPPIPCGGRAYGDVRNSRRSRPRGTQSESTEGSL